MSGILKFKQFILKISQFIKKVLILIFGSINWNYPQWLKLGFEKIKTQYYKNKKKFIIILTSSLLGLMGIIYGIHWYKNRPQPDYVNVTAITPAPLDLNSSDSKPNDLRIEFDRSVKPIDFKEFKKEDIVMSPGMKGQWSWRSDSELSFKPETDWRIDQEYEVKFKKNIFAKKLKFEKYETEFKTKPFVVSASDLQFYINPENRKEKKITAELYFSHEVKLETLKKYLVFEDENDKELKYEVTVSPRNHIAYIVSENIKILEKEMKYFLKIKPGIEAKNQSTQSEENFERKITAPSIYNYFKGKNLSINIVENEKQEAEQVLAVEFTDAVNEVEMRKYVSIYLLPKKDKGYWSGDDNDLEKNAQKLSPSLIPNERDDSESYFYKIKQDVDRQILVKISKGLKSASGFELPIDFKDIVRVPEYPSFASIQQKGGILSLLGDKKLSLQSRGLEELEIKIHRLKDKDINHLLTQSYGSFEKPSFDNYNFNQTNISEIFNEKLKLDAKKLDQLQYSSLDLEEYLSKGSREGRGIYYLEIKSDGEVKDSRLLVLSDLSIIYKKNNQGLGTIFVHSIKTGNPVSNAEINVIGKNGISVYKNETNGEGSVDIINLSTFRDEKNPVFIQVKKDQDLSFLPLNRYDREINFSRFDTGGFEESSPSALSAFIFNQRGIFRPGETVYLGYIVRSGDWKGKLLNVPVELEIINSRGVSILKHKTFLKEDGFGELNFQTQEDSPTGVYTVALNQIGFNENKEEIKTLIGQSTFKVEDFEPDSLTITSSLSNERKIGWNSLDGNEVVVQLRNLFGTPAVDNKVSGQVSLTHYFPEIKAYKNFYFYNPNEETKSMDENLGDRDTDEQGEAKFPIDLEKIQDGLFQLVFKAEGFEKNSGRSVVTSYQMIVSNRPYIIGHKTDKADLDFIKKDEAVNLELIALNQAFDTLMVKGLTQKIVETKSISTLMKGDNGLYKYQTIDKKIEVLKRTLDLNRGTNKLKLPTDKVGNFELIIENEKKMTFFKIQFSVVGNSNEMQKLTRTSELDIKLNKEDYESGEEIEIQLTGPYAGSGLITIERDKIYASEWFKSSTNSSIQKIKIPSSLEGNAYINVIYARDINSKEIFTSPLSFAVKPFSLSRKKRVSKIDLKYNENLKPGDELKIKYSTSENQKIILFGVDQGILQVAKYKAPDPLGFFFKKKMLQVQTLQLIDLIMPEYSIVKEIFSAGGDAASLLANNLNPFKRKSNKPVVFWSGILDSSPSEKEFSYTVPDYFNGTIKIFAVSVNQGKIGVIEEESIVKGDFIIDPKLPIFTAPGDQFNLSVLVTNNLTKNPSEKVTIEIKESPQFKILGEKKQIVDIKAERDTVLNYKVETLSNLGASEIEILSNAGDKMARMRAAISVRAATPYQVKIQSIESKGKPSEVMIARNLFTELGSKKIRASFSPLVLALGLEDYLNFYPFGCTEQLVSKAIPALYLGDENLGLRAVDDQKWQKLIQNIKGRQNVEGMMMLYPGLSGSSFVSIYATHFLIEAKLKNKKIDLDLLVNLKRILSKTLINKSPDSLEEAREMSYALYVLSLDGEMETNALVSLRQKLDKNFKDWKKDITALFLAGTYKKYKMNNEADQLFSKIKWLEMQKEGSSFFNQDVSGAYYLIVLADQFSDAKEKVSFSELQKFIDKVSKKGYSSLSAALSIMALAKWPGSAEKLDINDKILSFKNAKDKNSQAVALDGKIFKEGKVDILSSLIKINPEKNNSIFYQFIESGFENKKLPLTNEGFEVFSRLLDDKNKEITTAEIGQTYNMEISLRALDNEKYNLAVVQLLPAGFEYILKRNPNSENSVQSTQESEVSLEEGDYDEGTDQSESAGTPDSSVFNDRLEGQESNLSIDYMDLREDRIILYLSSLSTSLSNFKFNVKAVYKGSFIFPGPYGEGMYNPEYKAIAEPKKIEVIENP